MTKQEYKDKNNDLQKYVGCKVVDKEIVSIFMSVDHSIHIVVLSIEDKQIVGDVWFVDLESFSKKVIKNK